jgi:hypothetical protein
VYELFKKKVSPADMHEAFFVLYNFLKIDRSVSTEVYQTIFDELVELQASKLFTGYEALFFSFLLKFSSLKSLDFSKHYAHLFGLFFRQLTALLPGELANHSLRVANVTPLWFTPCSPYTLSAVLLAKFLVPSTHV